MPKDNRSDGGNASAALGRCLLDEEPDAEGFYHCIRLRDYRMQPAHGSSHAVEVHSLSVKPSVLSPNLREALDQSQPSLVSIENNQGSLNVQKSSIEETNISGHNGEPETSSLIINPVAGAAREDEKVISCDFGGNTIYVHYNQGQDQGGEHGSFGEETDTEDLVGGSLSEGSNFSTDNCHMDGGLLNNDKNELPYRLRSGRGQTFFELLPGCSASLGGVMARSKTVAEAPYSPGVSQEVLPSEVITPVATAPAIAILTNTPRWCHSVSSPESVSFPENDRFEDDQGKGNEGKDEDERKDGIDNGNSPRAALTTENLLTFDEAIAPIESIETLQGYRLSDYLLPLHCTSVDGTWAKVE